MLEPRNTTGTSPTPRQMSKTERLSDDTAGIARAAALLRSGRIVAFPTETVYGLGADATDARAVARIYEAKGRPHFNPLIVHVESLAQAEAIGRLNGPARALAHAFWPGPLSLVVDLRPEAGIASLVTAGGGRVALRVPGHPLARRLISETGRPLAAPSANPSGQLSPTRAAHVLAALEGRIDAVLDGGPCAVGLESTIVATGPDGLYLLRPGGIPAEEIVRVAGISLHRPQERAAQPESPGQLESHYAPRATLRLGAQDRRPGEIYVGFGSPGADLELSASGDLVEAAARLFDLLHEADAMAQGGTIAIAPIPQHGLGLAINDRLRRAAAPRLPA